MIRPFTTVAVGAVLLLGLTGCGSASAQNPTVTPAANADFFEPAVATPVAIPGVELFTGLSRDHTTDPVEYEQSPPVGGAHDPSWQRCLVYDAPILRYLAQNDFSGRIVVLPVNFAPQDYAFALPEGSVLRRPLNQELIAIKTSDVWKKRVFEYLGER